MMKLIKLDEEYFVTSQITIDILDQIKKEGFDVIINNRPDNEEEKQPLSLEFSAAKSLGLKYVYNPVNLSTLSEKKLKSNMIF